jgi:segregation and condensation protein A
VIEEAFMSVVAPEPGMLGNYQLRLPGYEGPLDVLLRLIERHQLEIADVSLVQVTAQFLAYVDSLVDAPPEVIASFTTVGTRLAVLKSRSLLPKPPSVDEDDTPSDLTRQLIDYRRAREASAFLARRTERNLRSYARSIPGPVDPAVGRASERLIDYPASALVTALRRRLTVLPKPGRLIPARKVVSLREAVDRLLHLTRIHRRVTFSDVVSGDVSRTEVATVFLGVLVLMRRCVIAAEQSELFSEIHLDRKTFVHDPEEIDERFETTA